jgi:IclR family pca regulon transcriptional regulator
MTQTKTSAGVPLVRALDRGIAILAAFTPERPALTLTELSRAAALDKGTTRRLLQTLLLNRLVAHDGAAGTYALAGRVLSLAAAVPLGSDLRTAAAGVLRELAAETGATSFLWTCDDGMALCLDSVRVKLPDIDVAWFAVGGRAALNSGAGPRVLLAHLPARERERVLAAPLASRTPAAETDPDQLRCQAERIRARGWDFARDDFVIGLAGLGVPILSAEGALLGALSIASLTSGFGDPEEPGPLDVLRRCAARIAALAEGGRRP